MAKSGAIRWTPEQLAEFQRRTEQEKNQRVSRLLENVAKAPTPPAPNKNAQGPGEAFYALGRLAKGDMNKTEAAYAQLLEAKKHTGEIIDWRFHPIRVRLADRTYYEPDFLVMTAARELQIHETKGAFTTDKGQMKIKLCAEVLPWFRVFKCSKQKDGSWAIQEFSK
jgi:hypothetical protein